MTLKPKKRKLTRKPKPVTEDKLILLQDNETKEYYQCNQCESLIVEGDKKMRSWGWCPICRYPRNKYEVTKVKSGKYWNLDTLKWENKK